MIWSERFNQSLQNDLIYYCILHGVRWTYMLKSIIYIFLPYFLIQILSLRTDFSLELPQYSKINMITSLLNPSPGLVYKRARWGDIHAILTFHGQRYQRHGARHLLGPAHDERDTYPAALYIKWNINLVREYSSSSHFKGNFILFKD